MNPLTLILSPKGEDRREGDMIFLIPFPPV